MIVSSLSSRLLVLALAANPGEGGPECPAGYICIEARCASPCRTAAEEATCPAPAALRQELPRPNTGCCPAGRTDADAVPAVAHRETPAPAPPATAPAPKAPVEGTGEAGDTERRTPAKSREGFRDWAVGAAAGLNFGSTLWLDRDPGVRTDHDTDGAAAFLVFADAMTSRGVSVGAILYSTSLDGDFGDANLLGLGGTLKARFRTRSNLELRPGILLAYQKMDVDTLDDSVTGLGAGVLLDVATSLGNSFGLVTTLGVLGQPAGGNGETDLTFGPAFFWTGGIEFGN
jgi:hypothetical protein